MHLEHRSNTASPTSGRPRQYADTKHYQKSYPRPHLSSTLELTYVLLLKLARQFMFDRRETRTSRQGVRRCINEVMTRDIMPTN